MRKFFLPVIFVVVLIISFSFSTFAAAEPFYVFDLSNLDAVSFEYWSDNNSNVSTNETYSNFLSFSVTASGSNLVHGINSIFSFDVATGNSGNAVYLQSGVTYTFNIDAWNSYQAIAGGTWNVDNFINQIVLILKNSDGVVSRVAFDSSRFTSEWVYRENLQRFLYAMSFSLDGSIYSGLELTKVVFGSRMETENSSGVSNVAQCFSDFKISAVNSSEQHWQQDITGTAPPGSDQANNNHNQEQDILNSISGGVTDSNSLFSDAISLWTSWTGSIALVTRIFNMFKDISSVNVILIISLSFGISGFLFNLGSSYASYSSRKAYKANRSNMRNANRSNKGGGR